MEEQNDLRPFSLRTLAWILNDIIKDLPEGEDRVVGIDNHSTTLRGQTPITQIDMVSEGFDWDAGIVFLHTQKEMKEI